MKLSDAGLRDRQAWEGAQVRLPGYDRDAMRAATEAAPVWVHFGAGNIFRGFIAGLQQRLLEQGLAECGIIAADTFDYDILDRIYAPHDSLTLAVGLHPDGTTGREVIASIAKGLRADSADAGQMAQLRAAFASPSLQMVSFTITEKGYALTTLSGQLQDVAAADMAAGPAAARHAMSMVAALMYERYCAGAWPVALVSMDNCSRNGEKLRGSVLAVVHAWAERGLVPAAFVSYMKDETRVSFLWSMIDKITPRPDARIAAALEADGIEDMAPIVTSRNTFIAPFVNAEVPQYLVIEDRFPNGRPRLEQAGVYLTDRQTVNRAERMKVSTCLNPLHTALAVFGCLLGYDSIAAEMQDPDLKRLVERIGYDEGLPVATDPGILSPTAFLHEVIDQRLPNPFIPDTPQRIATDTSMKVPIRFGETIKAYAASESLRVTDLTAIPLAIAAWLRYLLGVDDAGQPMPVSDDPQLPALQAKLAGIVWSDPVSYHGQLRDILCQPVLFGADLCALGLSEKIERMFVQMLAGPGAVRAALKQSCGAERQEGEA